MGGAARDPARAGAQPPRGPHRGPPARVPRLPRRDPRRPVRRGDDGDLGPGDVRAAQVPRGRGDGHLPRRAAARQLRAVPHARRRLDDPPDGPAGRPGPRADARAARADARPDRRAAARRRPLGVRDQVGRGARDRVRAGRPADPARAQRQRHLGALPRAAPDRGGARRPRGRARRRGRGVRRRPAELPEAPGADAPDRRRADPAARPRRAGPLHRRSTCSTSTGARSATCPTRSAAPGSPSWSWRARRGRRRRTTSATAPRCST